MSSTGLLASSPAPFGTDADAGALSVYSGLYPTNYSLRLGLDLERILSPTLLWNDQAGITCRGLDGPANTTSTATQENQQESHKFEKPGTQKNEHRHE